MLPAWHQLLMTFNGSYAFNSSKSTNTSIFGQLGLRTTVAFVTKYCHFYHELQVSDDCECHPCNGLRGGPYLTSKIFTSRLSFLN